MKKIIGIDIDGVITDEGKGENNIWRQKMSEFLGRDIPRFKDEFNFKKAFNISQETLDKFLKEHLENIYKNAAIAPGARQTIKMLKQNNFTVFIITARNDKYNKLTKNWLEKNNIPHDKLFHEENKAPLALNKNIELFIEDNANNTRDLIDHKIPVILVNKYHNQDLQPENNLNLLYRVNNWKEIREIILDIFDIEYAI